MSKQTDNKQFWQRWASCYGPLMQSSEPLYAAITQQMQPHLTPEMNVLELACGPASSASGFPAWCGTGRLRIFRPK